MSTHHIEKDWAAEMASRPGLNSSFRLFLLAVARADEDGHAKFFQTELSACLPILNRQGETVPMAPSNLYKAINGAVASELLVPGSSSRELILPVEAR